MRGRFHRRDRSLVDFCEPLGVYRLVPPARRWDHAGGGQRVCNLGDLCCGNQFFAPTGRFPVDQQSLLVEV